jgi:hypothetical protein
MFAYMIISAMLLVLACLFVLNHAIKTAATGYEDEFGFHEGSNPERPLSFGTDMEKAVAGHGIRALKAGFQARRVQKRAAKKSAGHAAAAPLPN